MLIAGAAGRDFHNFNVVYRDRDEYEVVAFTATQIPNIDGRVYPAELAGSLYPDGIPILPESALEQLVARHEIDEVVFAYSDVTHEHVMHIGSRALAAGGVLPADRPEGDDDQRRRGPWSRSARSAPGPARARRRVTSRGCCTTRASAWPSYGTPCRTAT